MAEISDLAHVYLRAYAVDGVEASGQNRPDKDDGLAVFDAIDEKVVALETGLSAGIKPTVSVRVATTTNGTISTAFDDGSTVDGVTLATGDVILLKDQSAGAVNGPYVVVASGSPTRLTGFTTGDELFASRYFVREGTANANKTYGVQNTEIPEVGTDAIVIGLVAAADTSVPGALDALRAEAGSVASATGIDIYAATGDLVPITGTTDVETLGTAPAGVERVATATEGFTLIAGSGVLTPDGEDLPVAAGASVIVKSEGSNVWRVVGGSALALVLADGVTAASNAAGQISPDLEEDYAQVWFDSAGDVVAAIGRDGTVYEARDGVLVEISSGGGAATGQTGVYDFDYASHLQILDDTDAYHMVLVMGQSLAQGVNGLVGDTALTTTALHPGYALMFDEGTRPQGADVADFVDLAEADFADAKETICSGMADIIMTGLDSALGKKPKVVFTISARGGATYAGADGATDGLKRGSDRHAEAIRLINRASEIAISKGGYLASVTLVWAHGETDQGSGTAEWEYMRGLSQVRMDLEAECGKLGIMEPMRAYTYQTCRGSEDVGVPVQVANAQLKVQNVDHGWRCVGPNYFAEDATGGQGPGDSPGVDTAHASSYGYFCIGMMFGESILRDLFGAWDTPMRVLECWWESSTVFALKYPYPVTIESDDSRITISTLGNGKGIDFDDGSVTPPTVSSIAVSGSDTAVVEVTLSGAPTGLRPRAFVASRKTVSQQGQGPVHGIRSGIRSTASYGTDPYESEAQYRWACTETIDL
jgi:hypothetical protein